MDSTDRVEKMKGDEVLLSIFKKLGALRDHG